MSTEEQVIARTREKTAPMVGNDFDVTQPIEMRFNELIGGVRSDFAVKIFGEDTDELTATAQRVATALHVTPGAADVRVSQTRGFPTFDIGFDRAAIARYGLTLEEVADTAARDLRHRAAAARARSKDPRHLLAPATIDACTTRANRDRRPSQSHVSAPVHGTSHRAGRDGARDGGADLLAYSLAGANASAVLGTALAIKMVAYVGIAPVVGAFANRLSRRAFLVAMDLVRAAVAASLPFVDQVW